MASDIYLPSRSTVRDSPVTRWMAQAGPRVEHGQVIREAETGKAVAEILPSG
jgi:pyruvate/2-oxoglutarate dehydrogenase complex dihydrolipoamide acyltransferase (E2) component